MAPGRLRAVRVLSRERDKRMGRIKVIPCHIEGLYLIEPELHGDERGYFIETYNQRDMLEAGLNMQFVQDNQSMSRKGVLRGMHYQIAHPQGKLVRALRGCIYDVAVDLRKGSRTYGQWFGSELSEDNFRQIYIPEGFAHGYLTLSDTAVFAYKVTDFYHPGDEGGFRWNDPGIGIDWQYIKGDALFDGTPLLINERDRSWPDINLSF